MKTLLLLAQKTWYEFGEDNASQMAAAITYYVLFAIVPLTMFLVSIASMAMLDDERRSNAVEAIEDHLGVVPEDVSIALADGAASTVGGRYGASALEEVEEELMGLNDSADRAERTMVAETIEAGEPVDISGYELEPDELEIRSESVISETLSGVTGASAPLGITGFITLAFSASIAFMAVRRSLNFVWKVPHRPFAQQRIMELSMLIGLALLLSASVATTVVVQVLRELNDGSQSPFTSLDGVLWLALGFLLPWALTFLLVLLAYWFVPNARNSFSDVWLGAILAAVALEILKYGYGVYVVNFSRYGAVYGALGGILIFMFLIWLASYIFLMGAELASEYPKVMKGAYSQTELQRTGTGSLRLGDKVREALRGMFFSKR